MTNLPDTQTIFFYYINKFNERVEVEQLNIGINKAERFYDRTMGRFVRYEKRTMFHVAIGIRFVDHSEYYDIVAHFYGEEEEARDFTNQKVMVDKIYEEWSKQTGYRATEIWYEEPKQYSDVEEVEYDEKLFGTIEIDDEVMPRVAEIEGEEE